MTSPLLPTASDIAPDRYKVWSTDSDYTEADADSECESRVFAVEPTDGQPFATDATDAAIQYVHARIDSGDMKACTVRGPDGALVEFDVRIEWRPIVRATPRQKARVDG